MTKQANQEPAVVLSLIQDIKDGRVEPGTITKEMRHLCVEVFLGEGYSKAHMAQILKRSEKTISRDIEDILLHNSLVPNEELWKKTVGELRLYTVIHRSHLMRLARTKGASVSERLQAEYLAFKVLTEYIQKLQLLGYLPTQPQAVVGEISLNISNGPEKSYQDLCSDINELEKVYENVGDMPIEIKNEIDRLRQTIAKASIASEIKQLEAKTKENDNDIFEQ